MSGPAILPDPVPRPDPVVTGAGDEDRAAILQLQSDWIAAESAGRIDDLLDLCTVTIALHPPIGPPIQGLDAVGRALRAHSAPIKKVFLSDVSLVITDAMAVKRARFVTVLPDRRSPVTGWHVWILRPRWYVDLVAWSLDSLPEF
jgi:hypothetical protein